ncbi:hypothetical protein CEH05_17270 [Halobacillus halophilus]|uniref:Uncharacterized protein n=1 Tax=Halobacillus halophilus (strain ATCC 35676 / DSM 2266 / JCM 20832 / KCTC 3685 / LMG 17431 / NBRC 102448 / NCIMB 2269) TaxID=866895 RepID=I0JRT4_HALH3|nr:hypothetical protein [Halobacillus halophilus]ASF40810.1 hypothetical protein CEH05_17270 [Halobacillus halophilus]CCG46855.1 hypothetical protein HBHAL_4515 [Halobacillus halophilus DSM 2266]
MIIPIILALITILSVVMALKKKRPILFALPIASIFVIAVVKIMMVPLPFWETVQFIFNLRG